MASIDNKTNQIVQLVAQTASLGLALFLASKLLTSQKKEKLHNETLLGIELGGTGCKIAIIDRTWNPTKFKHDYQVLTRFNIETTSPEETVAKLVDCVKTYTFSQIGIASFGPICLNEKDPHFGYVTSTPKLGWQNFPLLATIKSQFKCSNVYMDTDVNAAGLAEYELGNHKAETLVYVTVGTGVGVGVIVNGKPVHGLTHPEGGHILVRLAPMDQDYEGVCIFHKNCLEGLVSNVSIAKRLGLSVHDLPTVDENHEVWDACGFYLAQLCLNVTLLTSPEVIILGGGVMNQPTLLGKVQTKFTELLNNYVDHPRLKDVKSYIKLPTLGIDTGVLGGAVLCKHYH